MLEYNRSIAVILPAYNEELTIAGTLRAFHAVMPDAFFYVVDNNSTDATAHIAEETLANLGAQGGLLHEARQGKGNAVRRAFFEIDADVYVLVDADMTYPAEALPQLVALSSRERQIWYMVTDSPRATTPGRTGAPFMDLATVLYRGLSMPYQERILQIL